VQPSLLSNLHLLRQRRHLQPGHKQLEPAHQPFQVAVLASKEGGVQLLMVPTHLAVAMALLEGGVLLPLQRRLQQQLLLRVLLVQLLQLWQVLLGDLLVQRRLQLYCQCPRRILTLRWGLLLSKIAWSCGFCFLC
jgi:hypothetical protein